MFQLITETDVTLVHVNMRTEKHGNADVDAYDLDFTIEGPNHNVLGLLHPNLCSSMYFDPDAEQGQQTIEAVPAVPRHLRFKKLGDLTWQEEASGVDLRVIYGLGGDSSNIALDDGKASTRKVQIKDGGTAILHFRFSTSAMPDGALDKLRKLLKSTTTITMVRPEKLREDAVIDGSIAAFEADHPGSKPDAGDLFAAAHGGEPKGDSDWPFPGHDSAPATAPDSAGEPAAQAPAESPAAPTRRSKKAAGTGSTE